MLFFPQFSLLIFRIPTISFLPNQTSTFVLGLGMHLIYRFHLPWDENILCFVTNDLFSKSSIYRYDVKFGSSEFVPFFNALSHSWGRFVEIAFITACLLIMWLYCYFTFTVPVILMLSIGACVIVRQMTSSDWLWVMIVMRHVEEDAFAFLGCWRLGPIFPWPLLYLFLSKNEYRANLYLRTFDNFINQSGTKGRYLQPRKAHAVHFFCKFKHCLVFVG